MKPSIEEIFLSPPLADGVHQGTETTEQRNSATSYARREVKNGRRRRVDTLGGRKTLQERFSPNRHLQEATWERLRAKFPDEDPATVEKAIIADTTVESRTEDEEGGASGWRPEHEVEPQVLFDVIKSRSSNSG